MILSFPTNTGALMPEAQHCVNIHHYTFEGGVTTDEDGEPMFGYYFELMDRLGNPSGDLIGPYTTKDEVEAAAIREWRRNARQPA